ncbi:hypothetical protein IW01_06210 [Pectobacterium brasiliense]|nr:hypothetical protein IW01_06210 [Pectobacterium brasiliense]
MADAVFIHGAKKRVEYVVHIVGAVLSENTPNKNEFFNQLVVRQRAVIRIIISIIYLIFPILNLNYHTPPSRTV